MFHEIPSFKKEFVLSNIRLRGKKKAGGRIGRIIFTDVLLQALEWKQEKKKVYEKK